MKSITQIIHKFYQKKISSNSAKYYATKEYINLCKAKAYAEENDHILGEIKEKIKSEMPGYALRDLTNLVYDPCYIVNVLLHKGKRFGKFSGEGDVKCIKKLGGEMTTFFVFISVLGPYFYQYIETMSIKDANKCEFNYKRIENLNSEQRKLDSLVNNLLCSKGYIRLTKDVVDRRVDVFTEEREKGESTIFDCLFSGLWAS